MSSTKEWTKTIAEFAARTTTKGTLAPAVLALALWDQLVDATPVLSGLTRANWRLGVNAVESGMAVEIGIDEYRERQKGDGDPLPRPERPSIGVPRPGDVFYISNATVDPNGHQYLWHIIYETPSQPIPWVDLSIQQVGLRVPELIVALRNADPEDAVKSS